MIFSLRSTLHLFKDTIYIELVSVSLPKISHDRLTDENVTCDVLAFHPRPLGFEFLLL